jgi:hypothetical protein
MSIFYLKSLEFPSILFRLFFRRSGTPEGHRIQYKLCLSSFKDCFVPKYEGSLIKISFNIHHYKLGILRNFHSALQLLSEIVCVHMSVKSAQKSMNQVSKMKATLSNMIISIYLTDQHKRHTPDKVNYT